MSRPGGSGDDTRSALRSVRSRLGDIGVVRAVVLVALVAVAARFILLGARTAHWDEARVAYWIIHTIETGDFAYRRIIHGPFVQHVNHVLFPLFGASDLVMRVPVALIGGLLPLAALLFREHLDDDETVVLAIFLGFNAVLIYYSRFMRSDVLVAAFMFVALGLLVRFYDTRRWRYLYGVGAAVALGLGSKENAVVYLLTWVGAAALLADQALYRPRAHDSGLALLRSTWLGRVGDRLQRLPRRVADVIRGRATTDVGSAFAGMFRRIRNPETPAGRIARWLAHPIVALVVFLAITVFLYGPRGAGAAGLRYPPAADAATLGLYEALGQPTALPGFVLDTLVDTAEQFGEWFAQSSEPGCRKDNVIDGWLCYLGQYLEVMRDHALVLSLFAGFGFLYERYASGRSRNLVMFAFYAGFVSILGYPLGTDVFGAWIVVHAVVPLALPAAVGVARLYRWGREARTEGDDVGAALAAVVLVVLAGLVGVAGAGAVAPDHSRSNSLVQYAQPGDDLDPLIAAMDRSARESGEGPDVVLYYGATGDQRDDDQAIVAEPPTWQEGDLLTKPPCAEWFNTLPLPWYFQTTGANVTCETDPAALADGSGADRPGVIISVEADDTVPRDRLTTAGYESRQLLLRSFGYTIRVYVHQRIGGV